MDKYLKKEIPIRAKLEMIEEVAEIIGCLHRGERSAADLLIETMKMRAVHLEEKIQQDVLMFAEQVQFQYDYDPWHKVTLEVTQAADRLIRALNL